MAADTGGNTVIANGLRKAIDRVALLRGVIKSRPGQHLVQTVRGTRVVHEPLRFAALQLGPPRAARYRLRHGGLQVFLRHGTRDVHILNEIFGATAGRRSYEPPSAVAQALEAISPLRVLDLGANIGLFGAYVLSRWPRAEIRSFEPDPANLSVLSAVIAANELEGRWSVAEVAVANRTGEMTFAAGLYADSHLLAADDRDLAQTGSEANGAGKSIGVRMVDIFAEDHDVDLMKMDIEGGEWAILTDARLSDLKARVLVLEWHARGAPEPDAHAAAVGLLRAAGYSRLEEVESGPENGLLWAWRETGAQPAVPHGAELAPDLRSQAGQAGNRQAIAAEYARAVT
jgi:FkbM family methyltransferase